MLVMGDGGLPFFLVRRLPERELPGVVPGRCRHGAVGGVLTRRGRGLRSGGGGGPLREAVPVRPARCRGRGGPLLRLGAGAFGLRLRRPRPLVPGRGLRRAVAVGGLDVRGGLQHGLGLRPGLGVALGQRGPDTGTAQHPRPASRRPGPVRPGGTAARQHAGAQRRLGRGRHVLRTRPGRHLGRRPGGGSTARQRHGSLTPARVGPADPELPGPAGHLTAGPGIRTNPGTSTSPAARQVGRQRPVPGRRGLLVPVQGVRELPLGRRPRIRPGVRVGVVLRVLLLRVPHMPRVPRVLSLPRRLAVLPVLHMRHVLRRPVRARVGSQAEARLRLDLRFRLPLRALGPRAAVELRVRLRLGRLDAGIGPRAGAAAAVSAAGPCAGAPPASGHWAGIVQVPVALGSVLPDEPSGMIIGGGTKPCPGAASGSPVSSASSMSCGSCTKAVASES
ncbi:hypothetical protein VR44_09880 [Streptomyces katrae]|uniref:Uncharacterized protein n=1 Tax=Streptomyces katrae TaxID=68223 RepID=A0A0F4JP10_9ACTN|nr:hypothetical protein VR44_09880 [Streptomyces katrae]